MADLQALKAELDADPLTRGYSGMTDAQAATDLNTEYRQINRVRMSGDEIFGATDSTEFGALSADKKQLWMAFCGREFIDPFGSANVEFVTWIFGSPSATLTALQGLRKRTVSRAVELRLGRVAEGTVAQARAL